MRQQVSGMKLRTIGCVELNSIGVGIQTADEMVKAANVELVISAPPALAVILWSSPAIPEP